ncbi:TPA: DNA-directed RNA polymerase subunit omega, partial [Enterococcus faecium]|nr:DNA-directed RNA polymerase subunit omega [Enterococcus faecium]
MRKKIIINAGVIIGLMLVIFSGKQYADNILLWGGEDNIEKINNNLTILDTALENKEQKISILNSQLSSNNQTLEQLRTNIEVSKQKVASLENDKNQLVSEK